MRAILALAFLLVAAAPVRPARIPAAFQGHWAPNTAQCRDPDGMGILVIGPDYVIVAEEQTIIGTLKILRSTKTELTFTNRMRGEGKTGTMNFNLRLSANGQKLTWNSYSGYGSDKPELNVRCPK